MSLVVRKYGGTSVGSTERILVIADTVVQLLNDGKKPVIVVSAMGDSTDFLVDLANEVSAKSPDPREYDALVSTGENVSAALLSMAIIDKGGKAISLTGPQAGIKTETIHSKAKIEDITPTRVQKELDEGKAVIITGFQGLTQNGDVATIGRGGSDTSAVAMAASLGAKECEIYTDVDGIYTTDPRLVSSAKKTDLISYDEMLELASLGANVLHPRAVEFAKEQDIVLHVRSSFSTEKGTRVKELSTMETTKPVTGVALKKDEAKLSIIDVPDTPNVAGTIFSNLADHHINVDMIIQSNENDGTNTITFTVSRADYEKAKENLESTAKTIGARSVEGANTISKVSAVGVGMISKPGVAAKIFRVLGEADINIQLITTSEIKVSCVVDESDSEKALAILHDAFELNL